MKVLVTGAGGFIGSRVVTRLSATPDIDVVAGRRDGRSDPLAATVTADVSDRAGLERALEGIDAVVHTAYGDEAVTVGGTQNVLSAAERQGVRRVVHLSSIAVYGSATGTVDEQTPFAADDGGYRGWKIAAERAVLASSVPAVRLRPTIVYGPGSELWIDHPLRRLRSGRWGTLGALGEGTCNPVHVDDVAAAVEAALRCDVTGAYNINGTDQLTWNDWFRRIAKEAGIGDLPELSPARIRSRSLARIPIKAIGKARPGFGQRYLLGVAAPSEMTLFGLRASYPVDAAAADLGWKPATPLEQGLRTAAGAHR